MLRKSDWTFQWTKWWWWSGALPWGRGLSTFGGSGGGNVGNENGMTGGMGTKIPRTQAHWTHFPLSEWGSGPQAWLPSPPLPPHQHRTYPALPGGSCAWPEPASGCTLCSTQLSSPTSLARRPPRSSPSTTRVPSLKPGFLHLVIGAFLSSWVSSIKIVF